MKILPPPPRDSDKPGTVGFHDHDEQWKSAYPGDLLFSTVVMLATHYLKEDRTWESLE